MSMQESLTHKLEDSGDPDSERLSRTVVGFSHVKYIV